MPSVDATQLLDSLYDLELLQGKQMEEATGPLRQRFGQASDLAAEFVRRGCLTKFQAERLLAGQGSSLTLGPYLLLERLGQGGMGEVFKARHRLLNRIVALKVTRKELLSDPTNERRFLREIQATARLAHPNIVVVHDAARIDGTQFFAMEYIEGTDLARLVKDKGPLPISSACEYVRQAALGLQHAFEHGLVHRDVKPSNLLLTADGAVIKLLDLGVARCRDLEESDLTATGSVLGTPDYLAPEQATNSRGVDIRADIYSLGCTLYHLLTGHAPFPEGSSLEKALKHLHDAPAPIRQERPQVSVELVAVLDKMMAKKSAERYQRPSDVAEALLPFCHEEPSPSSPAQNPPAPAKHGQAGEPVARPRQGRRRLILAAAVLLPLAGAGLSYWQPWAAGPTATPNPTITNSLGMDLIWLPGGQFQMGSPADEEGRRDDEGPVHSVTISHPFYMATRETTVRQFRIFKETAHYKTEAEESGEGALEWDAVKADWRQRRECRWNNPGWLQDNDQPVVCVSRRDAEAFCYWLSLKESRTYRLPSEAEWEYACRAGTSTAFAFGDRLSPQQAHFQNQSRLREREPARHLGTASVGSTTANSWGLFDMHGNVWEWCADYYGSSYYRDSPSIDPAGPKNGDQFVARGGSWQSVATECRAAARLALPAANRRNDLGFRVLLEAGVR
jgi:formylglycine-generating enzyme required for sulfatase activity/tRNA A-37 threonylcarbamoyl transferase component Bud32